MTMAESGWAEKEQKDVTPCALLHPSLHRALSFMSPKVVWSSVPVRPALHDAELRVSSHHASFLLPFDICSFVGGALSPP